MFAAEELEKIKWQLNNLEEKNVLRRRIVLFGYSDNSIFLMNELHKRGYKVSGFIDNNPAVQGKVVSEYSAVKVSLAEKFLEKYDPEYVFLIVSRFYSEMKAQLEMHGYQENENIFRLVNIKDANLWGGLTEDNYQERKEHILRGRELYQELLLRYPNHAIMVDPVGSIGDVYLMGCYVKQFLEKEPKTVFLFETYTMAELAKEIGFGKVECRQKLDLEDIVLYARLLGFDRQKIQLLHTGVLGYRIWSRMLTRLCCTWMVHYRELFGLSSDTKPIFPDVSAECIDVVKKFFDKNNLKQGKTVILAPYANTIRSMQDNFWISLASRLNDQGYCVCTNVANGKEKIIDGTVPITMKLREMRECLEYAGYFVSMRSGLCDILGNCKCKKFILYTNEKFDFISVYDFYSLNKMGFLEEAFEYIVDEHSKESILENIVNKIVCGK